MGSFKTTLTLAAIGASLLTSSCLGAGGMTIQGRYDTAQNIASKAALTRLDIPTPAFVLGSWRKITAPGEPVNVYIEGDGLAWLSRSEPSLNPTPKDPLGLRLAAADPAANVVYIARPCQYNRADVPGNGACRDSAYWRGKRFAPEVVASYKTALDSLSRQYPGGFHLVGYSGGANIAGLAALGRDDVLSLKTVAGNVDNDFFTAFHGVSAMPYSLNMADEAAALSSLPQMHFIGGKDKNVPADIYQSYAAKTGASSCVRYKIVDGASHEEGWIEAWPGLLNIPVRCE